MKRLLCCLSFISLLAISTALFKWTHTATAANLTVQQAGFLAVENPLIVRNAPYEKVIPMRSVMFNFRPNVSPQRQDAILAQIETWDGISKTARLKPDAKRPEILRMCYAYVSNNIDIEALLKRLSALPEIESASTPAERRLL